MQVIFWLLTVDHQACANSVHLFLSFLSRRVDRGYQGVMKRHGFAGMPASHGVTKTHRKGGAIGNVSQTPGQVCSTCSLLSAVYGNSGCVW